MFVHINIKGNNSLDNSPITVGCNNKIAIQSTKDEIDWKVIQDELIEVSGKLPKSSNEYLVSKEALGYAMCKDKESLKNVLQKNSQSFLSDIFKGVASGALVEIIKYFISH